MVRVKIQDVLDYHPLNASIGGGLPLREHPSYDPGSDTIEVYESARDKIVARKAVALIMEMEQAFALLTERVRAATAAVDRAVGRARAA